MNKIVILTISVFLLNVPFGFWRGSTRKFSKAWFCAVHLPIPFVIGIRFLINIKFQPESYMFALPAYFLGQYTGGIIRNLWDSRQKK